jgi:site-specific DNA recombinase
MHEESSHGSRRAVGYVRVSTADQARHGLSLPDQREKIEWLVAANQGMELVEIFADEGVTASKPGVRRPGYERMLETIEGGEIDTVVAFRVDRFDRKFRTAVEAACHLMDDLGVRILATDVDTALPGGRQALYFGLMRAEQESQDISARVRSSRPAAMRKHGHHFGGRRKFGRTPTGEVIPHEAEVIRHRIAPALLAGVPASKICRDLLADGVSPAYSARWNPTHIGSMMLRPDLAGFVKIEDGLEPSSLEPILDVVTWKQICTIFERRRRSDRPAQGRLPTMPFVADRPIDVRCGLCGGPMRPRVHNRYRRPASYVCREREVHGTCTASRVSRHLVDGPLVSMFVNDLIDERTTIQAIEQAARMAVADARTALTHAEREVMRADERLARVRTDYQDGTIDAADWKEHRADIESGRVAAEAEVQRLRAHVEELEREGAFADAQGVLVAMLDDLRGMASRYDADAPDADLVAALRMAMSERIATIIIAPTDAETFDFGADVATRTVSFTESGIRVGVVVQNVAVVTRLTGEGNIVSRSLPGSKRVGLPIADNDRLTSTTRRRRPRRRTRSSS